MMLCTAVCARILVCVCMGTTGMCVPCVHLCVCVCARVGAGAESALGPPASRPSSPVGCCPALLAPAGGTEHGPTTLPGVKGALGGAVCLQGRGRVSSGEGGVTGGGNC